MWTQNFFYLRILRGLNSDFSFSLVSCHTKVKKPCLSFLPPPQLGQDMTQGQFFKQSLTGFPSPRLVASPRLKNPVCPTIYP